MQNTSFPVSHYRSENFRFNQVVFCLPSTGPYEPWIGKQCDLPEYVNPSDMPSLLPESVIDQFATQPEEVMKHFLESNPHYMNPRDIGRILFHSKNLSPYAVSLLLFNSNYSSQALIFSFISAIDLDCLSIVDAIRYVIQKVAIPAKSDAIVNFAKSFSIAYGLRNQLEWPNMKVIQSIFCATIRCLFFNNSFRKEAEGFKSLSNLSNCIIDQIAKELKENPPAVYFSSTPIKLEIGTTISGELEHEARYTGSWKAYYYVKENNKLTSKESKSSSRIISEISLDLVTAAQRSSPKRPYCMYLARIDGQEFGKKMKEGQLRDSPRTSYTLAFKNDKDLLVWISAINAGTLASDLKILF